MTKTATLFAIFLLWAVSFAGWVVGAASGELVLFLALAYVLVWIAAPNDNGHEDARRRNRRY